MLADGGVIGKLHTPFSVLDAHYVDGGAVESSLRHDGQKQIKADRDNK